MISNYDLHMQEAVSYRQVPLKGKEASLWGNKLLPYLTFPSLNLSENGPVAATLSAKRGHDWTGL